ncbi:MAG: Transcription-repair-coupling factor [Verrucomicrobiota bacterium]|jgi:transcription-repair coupling factor (superfamily II helicase)
MSNSLASDLLAALPRGPGEILVHEPELRAAALAAAFLGTPESQLAIVPDAATVEELRQDLSSLLILAGDSRPFFVFPEATLGSGGGFLPEAEEERALVLSQLGEGPALILTSAAAAAQAVPAPKELLALAFELKLGDKISQEDLCRRLVELGYDDEFQVNLPGEFARRGGILDVFPPAASQPLRLEFFGDEIEEIRPFDPRSQRSEGQVTEVRISPRAIPAGSAGHLGDYLGGGRFIALDLQDRSDQSDRTDLLKNAPALHLRCSPEDSPRVFVARATAHRIPGGGGDADALRRFREERLNTAMAELAKAHTRLFVACGSAAGAERLDEITAPLPAASRKKIEGVPVPLHHGFEIPGGCALLSEREAFGRLSPRAKAADERRETLRKLLEGDSDLMPGDFAVHAVHGICRFSGFIQQKLDAGLSEGLELEFDAGQTLFVPFETAHLVSRYIGGGKAAPKLATLGSTRWQKACDKAAESAKDFAAELLRLQAVRAAVPGRACAPDGEWQKRFEDSFPWQETPDQLTAMAEIKADMESPKPMDRLLCGDVGFGKTELAVRAAFKAVMDGRQVAVICPTTILARQHFETFSARMAEYPVSLRLLCRFVSPAKQRLALEEMATGGADIVIGTHRLLQKDVSFARIGLVIIDEEQRFGVEAKEQIKTLRATVDVLTLSATPIPRTLYLSLSGLRSFSSITTPPRTRKPVRTIVTRDEDSAIREALLREFARGGQAFYVHNRVQTLEKARERLAKLMPEANIAVAHGQMHEHELEDAMNAFLEKRADLLLCTSIIESGLDIPNANTIIIERADRFGLAELYQLRGRVGRQERQAWCVLLLPKNDAMMDNARARMAAIRRYTELGSGFKLALRDLELRGAGNILGAEQSGHVAAVGFELYCQLLKEAAARLAGRPQARRVDPELRFDFLSHSIADASKPAACIPPDYVASDALRLELHKRLALAGDENDLDSLAAELADRFGALPPPVRRLLDQHRCRMRAAALGAHELAVRQGRVLVDTPKGLLKLGGVIPSLANPGDADKSLDELLKILKKLKG